MKVERRQPTRAEWAAITSPRPVVRWVLERKPSIERSGVSEEDAPRRAREEIARLEAERVALLSWRLHRVTRFEPFLEFLDAAYNARARDKEWETR